MKINNSMFDYVAQDYSLRQFELPNEYAALIKNRIKIKRYDPILDLGCGCGLLTFKLKMFFKNLYGLDISAEMLKIARMKDKDNLIKWICSPVEKFDFKTKFYSLVISFESFHLFPQQDLILKRIYNSLNIKGYFAIGWCIFFWEDLFRNIIINSFKHFNIEWKDWGYQTCSHIPTLIKRNEIPFIKIETDCVSINSEYNLEEIADYLLSISKSIILDLSEKRKLKELLLKEFYNSTGLFTLSGINRYYIRLMSKG